MKNTRASLLVATASASLLLSACSQGSSPSLASAGHDADGCLSQASAAAAEPKLYVFSDAGGARSRVERTVRSDGSETLHGVTDVPASATRVTEYVEIDPAGRLVYADVILTGLDGGPSAVQQKRLIADAQSGTVRIRHGGRGIQLRLPVDVPWAYAAWTAAEAAAPSTADSQTDPAVVTPVAAWITFRATAASSTVRLIDGEQQTSAEVAADQLVVRGDGEHTIVLGNTGVSASDDFVLALRLGGEPSQLAWINGARHHRRRLLVTRLGAR